MKILKDKTQSFTTECDVCECVFQYDVSDVYTNFTLPYIYCPCCKRKILHSTRTKKKLKRKDWKEIK